MIDYVYLILCGIFGILAYLWRRIDTLYKFVVNHLSDIKADIKAIKVDLNWLKRK